MVLGIALLEKVSVDTQPVASEPALADPVTDPRRRGSAPAPGTKLMTFEAADLKITGKISTGGGTGPRALQPVLPASLSPIGMGWRAGWVQVNVQERCWALYRSSDRAEAVLRQWPSYTRLDVRGTDTRDPFCSMDRPYYAALPKAGEIELVFGDRPYQQLEPKLGAADGGGVLSAAGIRWSFVCGLAVRAPDDALFVPCHVPWFVEWSYDFDPTPTGPSPRRRGTNTPAAAGPVRPGAPPVLVGALKAPAGRSANDVASSTPTSKVLKGDEITRTLTRLRT